MTRVLFVCSGNICRSPSAEAILRALVDERGLPDIEVDSAGTGDWHVGEPSDPRSIEAAQRRGYVLDGRARQIEAEDFEQFDYILAVDEPNLARLRRIAPAEARAVVRKLSNDDVPDPYYGGPNGFEAVLDQLETECAALLDELAAE